MRTMAAGATGSGLVRETAERERRRSLGAGAEAGGDRADRDAGGTSAGLRSDGRQHVGEDDVARLSGPHRKPVRQSAADVVDGPWDSDRGSATYLVQRHQKNFPETSVQVVGNKE